MKQKYKNILSRLFILMMAAGLLTGMNLTTGVNAEEPAETEEPADAPASDPDFQEESEEETEDVNLEQSDETPASAEYPEFRGEQTVNGIKVTVTAEEGTFPEGTVLSVESVEVTEAVSKAVAEARNDDVKVAVSYTFDIKPTKDGEEVQPAEGKAANVSFQLAEAADQNLKAEVYHIAEADDGYTAEVLDVLETGEEVVIETTGFSCYTVEFTYNNLEYEINGDERIPLSSVLEELGLSGDVAAAEVSDDTLFTVTEENGEWFVTSLQAFDSNEWMKVTINGIVYEITVTDKNDADDQQEQNLTAEPHTHTDAAGNVITFEPWNSGNSLPTAPGNYYLTQDVSMNEGWRVPKGTTSLCLNGKTIRADGATGIISMRNSGAVLNLFDEPGNAGKLINTRSSREPLSGGVYVLNNTFNMYGGTISGNQGYESGAVYVEGGEFNMYGGIISGNTAKHAGGIFITKSTFRMSGGAVTGNNAEYEGGGSGGIFISSSTVEFSGCLTITDNKEYGRKNNLFLYDSSKIEITGPLTNATPIGISMKNYGTFTKSPGEIKAKDYINNFTSDSMSFSVAVLSKDLRLAKKKTMGDEADNTPSEETADDESQNDNGTEAQVYTAVEPDNREWQKGSSGGFTVTFKAKYEDENTFTRWNQKILIDGNEIPTSSYSSKAGSLVVDLKPAYLETLSAGTHTMSVTFTDGSASSGFVVKEKSSSDEESSAPETKTDNVVTCQMAGYPENYVWNEAARACQPGYTDADRVRRSVPNTSDAGLMKYITMNLISLVLALVCGIVLFNDR